MGDVVRGAARRAVQVRKAHPSTIGAGARRQFLAALAATCNVQRSAAMAGVPWASLYRLRARDARFAERWAEALARGYQRLEEALLEHALGEPDTAEDGDDGFADDAPALHDARMGHAMLVRRDRMMSGRTSPAGFRARLVPIREVEAALAALAVRLAQELGER